MNFKKLEVSEKQRKEIYELLGLTEKSNIGQFYINECIDLINDREIREKFKTCEFTTQKADINPLTDDWGPYSTRTGHIKYIDNIDYQMHVEYEDQYIRSMREDGILK